MIMPVVLSVMFLGRPGRAEPVLALLATLLDRAAGRSPCGSWRSTSDRPQPQGERSSEGPRLQRPGRSRTRWPAAGAPGAGGGPAAFRGARPGPARGARRGPGTPARIAVILERRRRPRPVGPRVGRPEATGSRRRTPRAPRAGESAPTSGGAGASAGGGRLRAPGRRGGAGQDGGGAPRGPRSRVAPGGGGRGLAVARAPPAAACPRPTGPGRLAVQCEGFRDQRDGKLREQALALAEAVRDGRAGPPHRAAQLLRAAVVHMAVAEFPAAWRPTASGKGPTAG